MNQPSTLKERILQYAQVHLGAEPEHLWAKFPRYAVLRHSENAKWFAVFLEFPGTRLGLERPESVDILDVKCGPLLAGSLLGVPGILPAYHMNKSNWVTLLLDGSLPEEEIIRLLELSYDLTKPGPPRPRPPGAPGGRRRRDRPYSSRRSSRLSRLMMRFSRREM